MYSAAGGEHDQQNVIAMYLVSFEDEKEKLDCGIETKVEHVDVQQQGERDGVVHGDGIFWRLLRG